MALHNCHTSVSISCLCARHRILADSLNLRHLDRAESLSDLYLSWTDGSGTRNEETILRIRAKWKNSNFVWSNFRKYLRIDRR